MLDVVNEDLIRKGEDAIAFDSDCREGICGSCGCMINGVAHGPDAGTTTCQLHMRRFADGQTIVVEPWRAKAFPVLKDLTVDRTSFDRIIAAGGYISAGVGGAQDAQQHPRSQRAVRRSDGFRGVHRLRRVRRGLQECRGAPVHQRQNHAPRAAAAGRARARAARRAHGRADGSRRIRQLLERRRMRSRLPQADPDFSNIAKMVREYTRAVWKGARA